MTQRGTIARKTTVGNFSPKKSGGLLGKTDQSILGQGRFGKSSTLFVKKDLQFKIPPLVVTPSEDLLSCLDYESNHLRSESPDLIHPLKSNRN